MKISCRFPALLLAVFMLLLVLGGQAMALSPEEEARIESMLAALGRKTDIVFIRNGSEHTAEEAVSHLRLKLGRTKKRLQSAEQFIDKVASSSSISGKPYMIRKPGEEPVPAGPFLHELLKQAVP